MAFEGAEKRLEITFSLSSDYPHGLRYLNRSHLDEITNLAQCFIVSKTATPQCDGYVLSESSLFISETTCIMKTCGKTKILNCINRLMELACALSMKPTRIKYSRSSFLFPQEQDCPYGSFSAEVTELRKHFVDSDLHHGCSYILGNEIRGLQWHIYYATSSALDSKLPLTISYFNKSVEIGIMELNPILAQSFVRSKPFLDARTVTITSGIGDLLPGAVFDDYLFDPCGYSMNGFSDLGILSVHVTPEEKCSYASIEFCCLHEDKQNKFNLSNILTKIIQIFNPKSIHVAVHSLVDDIWCFQKHLPGFIGDGLSLQYLRDSSHITFKTYHKDSHDSEMNCLESQFDDFSGLSECTQNEEVESSSGSDALFGSPLCLGIEKSQVVCAVATPDLSTYIRSLIAEENLHDSFYICNLSIIRKLCFYWKELFPRVEPFYAVKCNPDKVLLTLLGSLGVNFDCATKEEIRLVKDLGIPSSRVIYANPCKHPQHMIAANQMGVYLTTFDTSSELQKMKSSYPDCQALIRIKADDITARCHLGNKYGAELAHVSELLIEAKRLAIDVVGVSFHVGSGATRHHAYSEAISKARSIFDVGIQLGFCMNLLDIGGGFCSGKISKNGLPEMQPIQEAVNKALELHFPQDCGIRIIAEPGRLFAEKSFSFVCQVQGTRDRFNAQGENLLLEKDYWITDGLYGSFNCIIYDHASPRPLPLTLSDDGRLSAWCKVFNSTVFGPTCDGLDVVLKECLLPELMVGDWLCFLDMGAYTIAGASNFNGIEATDVKTFYIWADFDD